MNGIWQKAGQVTPQPPLRSHSVLILGDKCDYGQLINERLESDFVVKKVDSVSMALDILQNEGTDILIVCERKPGQDLKVLCKSIKTNKTTHHIGIIVISDSMILEHQIEFYNCDIDALFTYPIDLRLVVVMIGNLLRKGKIKSELLNRGDRASVNIPLKKHLTGDEAFITKAAGIIEANLNNRDFGFDQFAESMKISKSTLHRKMIELTDMSPVSFILDVRLKHSSGLLLNTSDSVQQIASAVGYNDPKYFSRSFKALFGKTPRDYRKTHCQ
ncbi:AraC family transcriptional regulator [Parabacteroides sp. FAFU027]|uniref:AraC family transcriptional regulator n=1 Tax=Parabacteroides sp. FAFU027 TaxID=2922715 RepID=UPI001FAF9F4A|nr:AraC family transcriptional regulator [Parabacteroides sp. FAFU027]